MNKNLGKKSDPTDTPGNNAFWLLGTKARNKFFRPYWSHEKKN